jgi:integral membrane protein
LLEGFSYLLILSITLGFISRDFVFAVGMTHGVLFILYLITSLLVSNQYGLSIWVWMLLFLASIIPFAFIPAEFYLKKLTINNSIAK